MTPRRLLLALALTVLAPGVLPGAVSSQELTVERIFSSGEWSAEDLPASEWAPDGERLTFLRDGENGDPPDLVAEDVRTGDRTVLVEGDSLVPPGERGPVEIEGYQWSPDGRRLLVYTRSQRVWRQNTKGVYFVLDPGSDDLRPLSVEFGYQQFAKFSPDGRRVGFVRENDLFVVDLETGAETRLTRDGSEDVINGTFDWVYEEELDLRDGWRWSPDGSRIAFWRLDQSPIDTFRMIDETTLYPEVVPVRYPKAGEANSLVEVGVVEVASGETVWLDLGDNPDVYVARMEWAESADELVVQRLNRHQNALDVLLADARTGETRVLFTEESDTWVDVDDELTWVDGGRRFLWSSNRDGYDHLYLYDRSGTVVRQLTDGPFDVALEGADPEDGWVYYTSSEVSPLERHLYRIPMEGGPPERLTERAGTHRVDLAPDGAWYLDRWSTAARPPEISLHRGDGTLVRTLVDNRRLVSRLEEAGVRPPEFFTFTTSDGVELNGWTIRPPGFEASRRYPVLMYVYGGPGSQTVTDGWGGSRYLWHQLLASRGIVVASVDNRGTGGRGREFQNVTYLDLGRWEVHDQLEAARHLASLDWVDPGRIGIWGWSYGGYMTLLATMKGGELFRAAISVAPVTDWKFYDTIYTERYMRTPRENPEGYRESAPLNHVEGLEADLLLVHGTGDDNVHYQNSVMMLEALQEAGKDFEFMAYPNKTHSIGGEATQVHLYRLMRDFLQEHLVDVRRRAAVGEGR